MSEFVARSTVRPGAAGSGRTAVPRSRPSTRRSPGTARRGRPPTRRRDRQPQRAVSAIDAPCSHHDRPQHPDGALGRDRQPPPPLDPARVAHQPGGRGMPDRGPRRRLQRSTLVRAASGPTSTPKLSNTLAMPEGLADNGGPTPTHALLSTSPAHRRRPPQRASTSPRRRCSSTSAGPSAHSLRGCDAGSYERVICNGIESAHLSGQSHPPPLATPGGGGAALQRKRKGRRAAASAKRKGDLQEEAATEELERAASAARFLVDPVPTADHLDF